MRHRAGFLVCASALIAMTAGCAANQSSPFTPPAQDTAADARSPQSAAAVPAATPAPTPTPIALSAGKIVGADNQFTPNDGDTTRGGRGQTVDGLPCKTSMSESNYHVHW